MMRIGAALMLLASCGGPATGKPTAIKPVEVDKPEPHQPPQLEQFVDKGKGLSSQRMHCPQATRPRILFTTGKLIARCETPGGKALGPVYHFHKGGSAAIAGAYALGNKQVGTWKHWRQDGTLAAVEEFDDDGTLLNSRRVKQP